MTTKEYYDKYIKKENEGFCKHCQQPSKPERNIIKFGYKPYCSQKCWNASPEKIEKIKQSCKTRNYTAVKEKFNKTCRDRYGADGYTQTEEWAKKKKETVQKRYGVDHNFQIEKCVQARQKSLQDNKQVINEKRRAFWTESNTDQVNENRSKSVQQKYGIDNVLQLPHIKALIRQKHYESGKWLVGNIRTDYMKYRVQVDWITRKQNDVKKLIQENIYDYYTEERLVHNNEYIKLFPDKRLTTNPMQPTIDHKISVFYGFQNNIPPEEIADINNLCVCSRRTNSSKGRLTESEFKVILESSL